MSLADLMDLLDHIDLSLFLTHSPRLTLAFRSPDHISCVVSTVCGSCWSCVIVPSVSPLYASSGTIPWLLTRRLVAMTPTGNDTTRAMIERT